MLNFRICYGSDSFQAERITNATWKKTFLIFIYLLLANCSLKLKPACIELIAEEYVRLVLKVGRYDSAVVDA